MQQQENVAVFWDYESCPANSSISGYSLATNLRCIAQTFGTVKAFRTYLDLTGLARFSASAKIRCELQCSGVSLVDCPNDGVHITHMLLVDMLAYAIDNPAPATLVIISARNSYSYGIGVLRLRHYRIVVICPADADASLTCQASVRLNWHSEVLMKSRHTESLVDPSVPHANGINHSPTRRTGSQASTNKRHRYSKDDGYDNSLYVSDDDSPVESRPSTFPAVNGFADGHSNHDSASKPVTALDCFSEPSNSDSTESKSHSPNPSQLAKSISSLPPLTGAAPANVDHLEGFKISTEANKALFAEPEHIRLKSPPLPSGADRSDAARPSSSLMAPPPSVPPAPPNSSIPAVPSSTSKGPYAEPTVQSNGKVGTTSSPSTTVNVAPRTRPARYRALFSVFDKLSKPQNATIDRSTLGSELLKLNPCIYEEAGVGSFKVYIRLAEADGIITLGGTTTVTLRSEWRAG